MGRGRRGVRYVGLAPVPPRRLSASVGVVAGRWLSSGVDRRELRDHQPHPGDIDACDDPVGVDVEMLHPALRDLSPGRPAQRAEFGCEFLPNIVEGGSGKFFVEFFQQDRDGRPKGIVVIDLETEEFES